MQAIHWDGASLRCIPDHTEPILTPDQALIGIRLAGICNTDLEVMRGYKHFTGILGHEFVGTVLAGPTEWVGQRVVGEINVTDGSCDFCQRGIPSQCRDRHAIGIDGLDGAFADRLVLPIRNLYAVPIGISDRAAVFTEPLAAAAQLLETGTVQPRDRVIVIGAGKLGLLCAQVLRLTGAEVQVVARRDRPRALLKQWGIPAVTVEELPQQRAQVVVDCTGNAEGFAAALGLVAARGTILLKSTYAGLPAADLTQVAVRELRIIGSRCGPFAAALRLLEQRLVDVESLIDAEYALRDAKAAFAAAAAPGALKILLRPD